MSTIKPSAAALVSAAATIEDEDLRTAIVSGVQGVIAEELAQVKYNSGTQGFEADAKFRVEGRRYSVQLRAFLIGSKSDPAMELFATLEEAKAKITDLVLDLEAHVFPSKGAGFYVGEKFMIHSQRYQVNAFVYAL